MLSSRHLCKAINGVSILHDIDVTLSPGQVTILIGPSGAGKTTLVKALSLLDPPEAGIVEIDGVVYSYPEPANGNPPAPWPKVTVVFQQLFLWPHLTLRENILLPLQSRGSDPVYFREAVDLFGISGALDRYPNEASLGERQRVALARAVALHPSYILLDEITSALDVEQARIILNYLLILRNRSIGLLLISHDLHFVRSILAQGKGDQFIFLDQGRILAVGGIGDLEKPSTPRLCEFICGKEISGGPKGHGEG